jgi:lysyl-tRNA synthetase class 2
MTYTLSRFRHDRPAPPFWLGGQWLRLDEKQWLVDALGSVLVESAFPEFANGDFVRLEINAVEGERVRAVRAEKLGSGTPPGPGAPHALAFPRFVNDVRAYFLDRGLTELNTPTLVACPGLEPALEPFRTRVPRGSREAVAYLPTSPEIHLKKAMGRGLTDVFEIKSCFRAGEYGAHHDHEFTMLEWYRGFADLERIIADLKGLLAELATRGWGPPAEVTVTDFATLFRELLGFRLTPHTGADELRALVRDARADDTFNDLFHRVLIDRLEPALVPRGPLVIRRFPPSLAALARLDAAGWADRFEFYWRGLEIANAFNEVTGADEQRARWAAEQAERARLGTSRLEIDEDLIEVFRKGFPPTGGIALGVERLYMAMMGVVDIRALKLFPGDLLFR